MLVLTTVFFVTGTALCEPGDKPKGRVHIGISLDGNGLPDLLVKHLRLSEGEGVRIENVVMDSPADKAGLERDDIVVEFEGKKVGDVDELIEAVLKCEAGQEVSLEIIHLGEHKTVKLKLEQAPEDFQWKYAVEPEIVQKWTPGRFFRLKPGDEDWIEMSFGAGPDAVFKDVDKYLKQVHTFHYSDAGEDYEITIKGNPRDEDSQVIVKVSKTEHKTTVKDIDKLPEKYRKAAEQALRKARQTPGKESRSDFMKMLPPAVEDRVLRFDVPKGRVGPGDEIIERLERQLRELNKRMDELERRHRDGARERSGSSPETQPQDVDDKDKT